MDFNLRLWYGILILRNQEVFDLKNVQKVLYVPFEILALLTLAFIVSFLVWFAWELLKFGDGMEKCQAAVPLVIAFAVLLCARGIFVQVFLEPTPKEDIDNTLVI